MMKYGLLSVCVMISAALGADKPYQPQGAPADPKVNVRWNMYHDYAAATQIMQSLAKAFPKQCQLISLGASYQKRQMWVMIITDPTTGADADKPAFWIDGGIHANEIQGTEAALYTAWYLLEMSDRSAFIGRLLRERTFYILPMMSPDSRDAHMHKPNDTHSPRSGQRPVDDDGDGLIDEDGPDDLDGDGNITQMRVRDPNGKFKPDDEYPQMMVRVKDGEKGQYTLLGEEGFDNDGDGKVNEDGDGYYDPNRDWPWLWAPSQEQPGAYRYPLSVPENRMVADFIAGHLNIAGAQSYHNAGGMILRGPTVKGDRYEPADLRVYDALGAKGELMLPGYRYIETATQLYETHGAELDWLYSMRGIVSFTNEMFTGFNFFRRASEGFFGSREDQRAFNKLLLFGDGVVPWHEVDHPQYGRIEVGGFKKDWLRQPPSFMLEEECHRNMAFTLYQADEMPLVKVQSVTVRDMPGGVREVTAIIENTKLTPTRLAVDVRHHINPPDRVTISAEGLKVITALVSDNMFFERPTEQTRQPGVVKLESIGGNDVTYVRWLIEGKGPVTVTVQSIKGGADAMTTLSGK
ncbi:MAG: peptidase M14 [Planctomycetes bacterium]|nr:peptidase M14 [Planctomycetota bacterium]